MAPSSSSSNKVKVVTMKLVIDTENRRVLFAEASKVVIDFLFNLLCLPIGTVVKLIGKKRMVGSLGNLYRSVEKLNENYMQPADHQVNKKDLLLNPKLPNTSSPQIITALLTQNQNHDHVDDDATQFYTCNHKTNGSRCRSKDLTSDPTTLCSKCSRPMIRQLRFVGRNNKEVITSSSDVGFVKDVVTFMVMDDLTIQPMSTISSIALLNKFNVKEIGTLQEKVVEMGMQDRGWVSSC